MFETVKRILALAGRYRRRLIAGIFFVLLQALFSALDLVAILYVAVSISALTAQLIGVTTVILLIGLVGRSVCKYQMSKHISGSSYDVFYERRLEAGVHLKKAPMGYYSEKNLGEIQMAMTTDMNALESSAMSVVENIFGSVIYAALCTVVLFVFNWKIGLVTLSGLAIGMLLLRVVQCGAENAAPLRARAQKALIEHTLEFIQGNTVMRLFGTHAGGLERVKAAFHQKQQADLKLENAAVWPINLYKYVFRLASCGVVLVAALLYVEQKMPFAICIMFLFSAFLVYAQMDGLAANIALLRIVDVAIGQVEAVLHIPQMPGDGDIEDLKNANIELCNVSFGYGARPVIRDISLTIPEHRVTAIVGPSGSGKTTLCNLIARFWDVDQGAVLVGGKNVKDIAPENLMRMMSIVFQNVYLFQDTIENNIKFGCPDATHDEVVAAARRACCHTFIEKLPEGYQTLVGEGGASLSGGEKQRLSIARAILKDAPIVILDEATSSVDPENQRAVLKAIHELTKNKTLITIAHRLSTIRNADQIVVLEDGRIVQQGTHEVLFNQEGTYRRFVMIREAAASRTL